MRTRDWKRGFVVWLGAVGAHSQGCSQWSAGSAVDKSSRTTADASSAPAGSDSSTVDRLGASHVPAWSFRNKSLELSPT